MKLEEGGEPQEVGVANGSGSFAAASEGNDAAGFSPSLYLAVHIIHLELESFLVVLKMVLAAILRTSSANLLICTKTILYAVPLLFS